MWDCLDGPFLFSPRLSRSPPFALFSVRLNEDRLYEQTKKNLHLLLVLTLLSVQRRLFVLAVCLVSLNIESAALRTLWRRRRLRKHLMQRCWSKAWIRFMKCILINHFKTANAALVLGTFFFRASSSSSAMRTPRPLSAGVAQAPPPCGEGFKNMLLSYASTRCLWGLTCHVEGMDLGNGPATAWALSCRAEEPTERMGKRTGPRTPTDLRMEGGAGRGGGGGGGVPPCVNLALISVIHHPVTLRWR